MTNSTKRNSGAKSRSEATETVATTPELHPRKSRKKPRFPLWLHSGTGQWAKKILGQMYYFGTDKDKALARYVWDKPHREAGRIPPPFQAEETRLTLKKLGDNFLS